MDSLYHIRTNVSVKEDIINDVILHSIQKEEVLFLSSAYI